MKVSTKQLLIIVAVVFVIFIAIGIWFYRKGKKTTTIAPVPNDNPNSNSPANNPAGVSDAQIAQIRDELYNEMNGVSLWRDTTPFINYMGLSDTDFVRVYNAFNSKYQAEGNGTLKDWIDSEYGIGEFGTVKDQILSRMGRLNLK